jgi:hypothetical protein
VPDARCYDAGVGESTGGFGPGLESVAPPKTGSLNTCDPPTRCIRRSEMLCSLTTTLTPDDLQAIQDLERELGKNLLAFSCYPVEPADIGQDELERIQMLEKRLGLSLVAVN